MIRLSEVPIELKEAPDSGQKGGRFLELRILPVLGVVHFYPRIWGCVSYSGVSYNTCSYIPHRIRMAWESY